MPNDTIKEAMTGKEGTFQLDANVMPRRRIELERSCSHFCLTSFYSTVANLHHLARPSLTPDFSLNFYRNVSTNEQPARPGVLKNEDIQFQW